MATIGGFELGEALGRGAQGEVWLGRHALTGADAAIKLGAEPSGSVSKLHSFLLEVEAASALHHPHIAMTLDRGAVTPAESEAFAGAFQEGTLWLALEVAWGGTLRQRKKHLDWERTRLVLLQMLDSLAHAHAAGVIHRDVKPANVLFREADGWHTLMTDFGMSALEDSDPGRLRESQGGTPAYSAPEQFSGEWWLEGPASDLYALGCVAWWCVTGELVYGNNASNAVIYAHRYAPLPRLRPRFDVPVGLNQWLRRLLAKQPSDRFARASHAAEALLALDNRKPWGKGWQAYDRGERTVQAGAGLIGVRQPALVGRVAERTRLWRHVQRVQKMERFEVLLVHGPARVGCDRLATWLGQTSHAAGIAESFFGRGAGLHGLLRQAAQVHRMRDDAEAHLARLFSVLPRTPMPAPPLTDEGEIDEDSLATVPVERHPDHAMAKQALPDQEHFQWLQALETLKKGGTPEGVAGLLRRWILHRSAGWLPVVVLEDPPIDEELQRLVAALRSTDRAGLIVVSARPGPAKTARKLLEPEVELAVEPLNEAEVGQVVERFLPVDTALQERLVRASLGLPGVAVSTLEGLQAEGRLTLGAHGVTVSDDGPLLPSGLREAAGARLERLKRNKDLWRAYCVACAFEGAFPAVAFELAAKSARLKWAGGALLYNLSTRGLVRPAGSGRWRVADGVLREAALQVVDPGVLQRVHTACALGLDGLPGMDAARARHLLLGKHPRKALALALPLMEGAVVAAAERDKLSQVAMQAVADLNRPHDRLHGFVFMARAHAIMDTAAPPLQRLTDAFADWVAASGHTEFRPLVWFQQARVADLLGDTDRAEKLLRRCLRESLPEFVRPRVHRMLAISAYRRDDVGTAIEQIRLAVEVSPLGAMRAEHLSILVYFLGVAGRYDEAMPLADELVETAAGIGRALTRRLAHSARGDLLRWRGELEAALADYLVAVDVGKALAWQPEATFVNLAMVQIALDRSPEAEATLRELLRYDQPAYVQQAAHAALLHALVEQEHWEALLPSITVLESAKLVHDKDTMGELDAAADGAMLAGQANVSARIRSLRPQ